MTIKTELLAIQETSTDGRLYPREVVSWARDNPGTALHKAIEWNNRKAADAYRLAQVRQMIEIYVINVPDGPLVISLSHDRLAGGGYRSVHEVAASAELRKIALKDALAELDRVQAKYDRITDLAAIWAEADTVRDRAGVPRRRARAATAENRASV